MNTAAFHQNPFYVPTNHYTPVDRFLKEAEIGEFEDYFLHEDHGMRARQVKGIGLHLIQATDFIFEKREYVPSNVSIHELLNEIRQTITDNDLPVDFRDWLALSGTVGNTRRGNIGSNPHFITPELIAMFFNDPVHETGGLTHHRISVLLAVAGRGKDNNHDGYRFLLSKIPPDLLASRLFTAERHLEKYREKHL